MQNEKLTRREIEKYISLFPEEKIRIEKLLIFIERNNDLFNRSNMNGHITASGILIENNKMLLVFHPYIKKWLQSGGHVDKGEIIKNAAIRETREESGYITKIHQWHNKVNSPIDIDIHYILNNPKKKEEGHYHFDFRYILERERNSHEVLENECETKWENIDRLEEKNLVNIISKWENIKKDICNE